MYPRAAQPCSFDIGDLHLRGKRWSTGEGMPTIALHGWLDNCASFDFLVPLLPQLDLVALDLAGHGLSDSRNGRGAYNIWQDIADVFAVADQLGWQQFALLGHSRGAIIATLAAGTLPARITHLALLEGVCPQLAEPEQAPELLAASIAEVERQLQRPRRYYGTLDEAVHAREQGVMALSNDDARALAERGVEQCPEGYAWRYDPKLAASSELRLSPPQMDAFVNNISAPARLVLATDGLLEEYPALKKWLAGHPQFPQIRVTGGHHCHMSTGADDVAQALQGFWE